MPTLNKHTKERRKTRPFKHKNDVSLTENTSSELSMSHVSPSNPSETTQPSDTSVSSIEPSGTISDISHKNKNQVDRANVKTCEKRGNDNPVAINWTYRDYSQMPIDHIHDLSANNPTFPSILHQILCNQEFQNIISWLPHGRSWKVINPDAFEEKVIPRFFNHDRYSSFIKQVNAWGFHRVSDIEYYHELFLRGLPHLYLKMRRPAQQQRCPQLVTGTSPNFYRISAESPLPEKSAPKTPSSNELIVTEKITKMNKSRTSNSESRQTFWNSEEVQHNNMNSQVADMETEAEKKAIAAEILRELPLLCLKRQMLGNQQGIPNSLARVSKASSGYENTNFEDYETSKKIIDTEDASQIDESILHKPKSTPEESSTKELHYRSRKLHNGNMEFYVRKHSSASSYEPMTRTIPNFSDCLSHIHHAGQFDDFKNCDSSTSSSVKAIPIVNQSDLNERDSIENESNISLHNGRDRQSPHFQVESQHQVTENFESSKHSQSNNEGKLLQATQVAVEVDSWKRRDSWEQRFNELKQFKAREGHCEVPKRYPDNPKLGNWVNKQRTQYKFLMESKPSQLNQLRLKALNEIGFSWQAPKVYFWNKHFEDLKKFKERTGHCLVPTKFPENLELGSWVNRQRMIYRSIAENPEANPSQIIIDRQQALDKIGFVWKVPMPDNWERHFKELKEFKEIRGHCNVPQRYAENPQLGRWIGTQRIQYKYIMEGKSSLLDEDRIRALESIGFVWQLTRRGQKRQRQEKGKKEATRKRNEIDRRTIRRKKGNTRRKPDEVKESDNDDQNHISL